MKIREIILENSEVSNKIFVFQRDASMLQNADYDDLANHLWTLIKRDCSDFLASMMMSGGKFLYRGMRSSYEPFISEPRVDRRPLNMKADYQIAIDTLLTTAGFDALRSNSLFVTSDQSESGWYGKDVYLIFPFDDWSYTWNTQIADLYASTETDEKKFGEWLFDDDDFEPPLLSLENKKKLTDPETAYRLATELGFTNTDFQGALESGHEIYLKSKYYAVPYTTEVTNTNMMPPERRTSKITMTQLGKKFMELMKSEM